MPKSPQEKNKNVKGNKTSKQGDITRALHDNKKADKTYWGEVDALYIACGTCVLRTLQHAVDLSEQANVSTNDATKKEVQVLINGIRSDCDKYTTDLLAIKALHDGKAGLINTDDELMLSVSIYQDYVEFNNRFNANMVTSILTLTELVSSIVSEYYNSSKPITVDTVDVTTLH